MLILLYFKLLIFCVLDIEVCFFFFYMYVLVLKFKLKYLRLFGKKEYKNFDYQNQSVFSLIIDGIKYVSVNELDNFIFFNICVVIIL